MFSTILEMSITGSIVAIVVIITRLFMKKLPAKFTFILWLLVGIRLICPVSFSSVISLFNVVPSPNVTINKTQLIEVPMQTINNTIPINLKSPTNIDLGQVLSIIWIIGVLTLILVNVICCAMLNKKLRFSSHIKDNIYLSKNIETPLIFGILRPKIYIPEFITEQERKFIIAHEKAHIKRFDVITKPIGTFILAVHWFNPIIWICFKLFENDMERACDEKAIADFNCDVRKEYANTLLEISMKQNKIILPKTLFFGENGIKSRIKNILANKKKTTFRVIVSVCLVLVLTGCLATSPSNSGELGIIHQNENTVENISSSHNEGNIYSQNVIDNETDTYLSNKFEIKFSLNSDDNKSFNLKLSMPTADYYLEQTQNEDTTLPYPSMNILIKNSSDKVIGQIGYDLFTPYTEDDVPDQEYYKTVYPSLRLSSFAMWTAEYYSPVVWGDNFETALCDVAIKDTSQAKQYEGQYSNLPILEYDGILSYNIDIGAFVAIKLNKDYFTQDERREIAKSIEIFR